MPDLTVWIIQKSTYHDSQTSGVYRWKAHIVNEYNDPICGIELDPLMWDQTIEIKFDEFGGCARCKRKAMNDFRKLIIRSQS